MSSLAYFTAFEEIIGEKVNGWMDKGSEYAVATISYFEASPFLNSIYLSVKEITGFDIHITRNLAKGIDYIFDLPPVPMDIIYSIYLGIFLSICIIVFNNYYPGEPMNWEIDYEAEMKEFNKKKKCQEDADAKSSKEAHKRFHIMNEISHDNDKENLNKTDVNGDDIKSNTIFDTSKDNSNDEIAEYLKDEDKILHQRGIQKLKTFFNLKDEEIVNAIRSARDEVSKENDELSSSIGNVKNGNKTKKKEKKKLKKRKFQQNAFDDDGFTLNQQANMYIYVIGLFLLSYFINHDYGNAFSNWFQEVFPKEAKVLFRS